MSYNGTQTNLYERTLLKYGNEYITNHAKNMGLKHGGKNRLSDEKLKIYKDVFDSLQKDFGWITKASKILGVSHTQIRRVYKKYFM